MYRVLIVDFSIYKDSISKFFEDIGYGVDICDSAFEAMSKLKSYDYDLVISEVDLPGDNSFDLYNYITGNYPHLPLIMTTEKNIDSFFDKIFAEGIGNLLFKPIVRNELINLSEKLITKKNIFGLHNYIEDFRETKKIRITSSRQIQRAIAASFQEIENWGFRIEKKMHLNLVLNEMLINAVYHSHGLTKEKEKRIPVTLAEGKFVDLFFGHSARKYGFAIDDYNGILTKMRILQSINRVIEESELLKKAYEEGSDISPIISETGRGIDLVRKLSGEYYFIIKKNVRTEIMLILDPAVQNLTEDEIYTSLKIIEDNSTDD